MANKDDLLIVISASGNSSNLLTLTAVAKKMGLRVAALTGFDGGKLFALAHVNVNVPTAIGDYGVSEDLHLIIGHIVKEVLILEENNGK
jgi:D-sedoheptulose 7-phosphate isomerase